MATACFTGFPAFTSDLMLDLNALSDFDLMSGIDHPQKMVTAALAGNVTWMLVVNRIPLPGIKVENGLVGEAEMLTRKSTVPDAPPSRNTISPAVPPVNN
jgi:hypothetical protein